MASWRSYWIVQSGNAYDSSKSQVHNCSHRPPKHHFDKRTHQVIFVYIGLDDDIDIDK